MNHETTHMNQRANIRVGMETPNIPCQKKVQSSQPTAQKVMFTLFWDLQD